MGWGVLIMHFEKKKLLVGGIRRLFQRRKCLLQPNLIGFDKKKDSYKIYQGLDSKCS